MEGSEHASPDENERVLKVLEDLFDKAYRAVLEKNGPCEYSPQIIKNEDFPLVDSEFMALVMASSELSDEQKQAELNEYNQSVYMGIGRDEPEHESFLGKL
jgi:hypothetical protein